MSFQFVSVTPENTEHNGETRRRIRSQAMRDYRQRQRVGDDSENSSSEDSPSSLPSPQQSSTSHSRQESRRRASSTHSLPIRPEPPNEPSSGTSREELRTIEDLEVAKSKRKSPQSEPTEERSESSRKQKRPGRPRAQYGVFGTFSVSLPSAKAQPPSISEDIDPLSSPGQLQQMLSICETYNRWLISNVSLEPGSSQTSGPWDNPTSQMLLFALCLKSIGHLDAIRPVQCDGDRALFKTRVLALANKRLKNPAKALEDKTIGALACLTSYEISRGSPEAMMHLTGLSQIIRLRGGTNKIGKKGGLSMFLEILDLLHAVYFNIPSMYTSADKSPPTSTQETPQMPAVEELPEFDQVTLDEISNFITGIPDFGEEDIALNTPRLELTVTLSTLESEVRQWHQFFTQAAQSIAPSYEGALAYICGLAGGLHLITTSATSPHPRRLQSQTEELFNAMANLPDDAWDAFQMLHVRILLTALSASQHVSQKSWYNAHLTRCLYRMGQESWSAVKGLILRFIDMQAAARQSKPQEVTALVNDIEIVVDPHEAES